MVGKKRVVSALLFQHGNLDFLHSPNLNAQVSIPAKQRRRLKRTVGMYFEIGEENKNFTPSLYQITWQDVKLTEYEKGVNFKLTLKKGNESHTFVVYPVYKGKNYDVAMKLYEKKYQEYRETLAKRKAEEKAKKEAYEAKLKQLEQQRLAQQKAWEAFQQKSLAAAEAQQKIYRAVQVSRFGTWNCDTPVRVPNGNKVLAQFQLDGKDVQSFMNVQLIEKNRNAVFTFFSNQFNQFQYNPTSENMLLAVMPDQKLAYLSFEDFAKVTPIVKAYTFNLKEIDKEFNTVAEVKAYLDI